MQRAGWLLGAGLLLAATARAEVIDIEWSPAQRFERRLSVAPGGFAEVCGTLAKGSSVSWRFDAGERLDFNVHYHEGKAVHYPVKRAGVARAEGRLRPKIEQDYCWMWSNKSSRPAALKVQLAR
jgi:hypothetical protein